MSCHLTCPLSPIPFWRIRMTSMWLLRPRKRTLRCSPWISTLQTLKSKGRSWSTHSKKSKASRSKASMSGAPLAKRKLIWTKIWWYSYSMGLTSGGGIQKTSNKYARMLTIFTTWVMTSSFTWIQKRLNSWSKGMKRILNTRISRQYNAFSAVTKLVRFIKILIKEQKSWILELTTPKKG